MFRARRKKRGKNTARMSHPPSRPASAPTSCSPPRRRAGASCSSGWACGCRWRRSTSTRRRCPARRPADYVRRLAAREVRRGGRGAAPPTRADAGGARRRHDRDPRRRHPGQAARRGRRARDAGPPGRPPARGHHRLPHLAGVWAGGDARVIDRAVTTQVVVPPARSRRRSTPTLASRRVAGQGRRLRRAGDRGGLHHRAARIAHQRDRAAAGRGASPICRPPARSPAIRPPAFGVAARTDRRDPRRGDRGAPRATCARASPPPAAAAGRAPGASR